MNKRGLTLIEVIISALILSITVGGILFVFTTQVGVVSRTGRRIQTMNFARQTLEQLRNKVGADTWPASGGLSSGTHNSEAFLSLAGTGFGVGEPFGVTAPAIPRSYVVTDIDPDSSGGDPDYKSVTVTVDWAEPQF